jgi:hypothetical protein
MIPPALHVNGLEAESIIHISYCDSAQVAILPLNEAA